jgi:Sulfotransferase family
MRVDAGQRKGLRAAVSGPLRSSVRRAQARVPALAGGRVPGPPEYIGVGAQRAGTSWWHRLIEEHPQVHPLGLGGKELHYFDRFWRGGYEDRDSAAYADLFMRPPGMICGEWTPRYMFDSWTPPLLRRAAPDARILVMLRDPVDRFHSGIWHAGTHIGPVDADVVNNAICRGRYGEQLQNFFKHIPREQVLVLQLERCRREPAAMLARTFAFLGLDPGGQPEEIKFDTPRNVRSGPPVPIDAELVSSLPRIFADDVRLLLDLVGDDIDPTLWPNFAHLALASAR